MDIKNHIQCAIDKINSDAERELELIKQQCIKDCGAFNQDLDQAKAKAETELAQKLNENISLLQNQFHKDKQALEDACKKKKMEHLNSLLETKTYEVTCKRDKTVSQLKQLIDKE